MSFIHLNSTCQHASLYETVIKIRRKSENRRLGQFQGHKRALDLLRKGCKIIEAYRTAGFPNCTVDHLSNQLKCNNDAAIQHMTSESVKRCLATVVSGDETKVTNDLHTCFSTMICS